MQSLSRFLSFVRHRDISKLVLKMYELFSLFGIPTDGGIVFYCTAI